MKLLAVLTLDLAVLRLAMAVVAVDMEDGCAVVLLLAPTNVEPMTLPVTLAER